MMCAGCGVRALLLALLAAAAALAHADDDAALELADQAVAPPQVAREWRAYAELARSAGAARDSPELPESRLALEWRLERSVAASWRLVWGSHLDLRSRPPAGMDHAIHTLEELYLSAAPAPGLVLDLGRVNLRSGVALGYNPSDFFRAGALRSYIATDPASLRENRQGSVMLRLQRFWDGGSLALAWSPRLQDRKPGAGGWDPDCGATNARHRLWLAASQRLSERFSPQWLAMFEQGRPPGLGLNLSGLLGPATVAYLEWTGSRRAPLLDAAAGEAWRSQWTAGLTHTLPNRLVLSAEWQHNGRGLDADAWRALRLGSVQVYAAARRLALDAQDPPTREALFLRADWNDALGGRLDLAAMWQLDATDHSRRLWLQARHRLAGPAGPSLIAQAQRSRGAPLTQYADRGWLWELAVRQDW